MVQTRGNAVFNIMIMMNSVAMDKYMHLSGNRFGPWTKYNGCKAWQDDPVQDPDYEDEERPAEAT